MARQLEDAGGNSPKSLTLTVPEVAKVLGISRNSAYVLAKQGTIPTLRLGRRIVVPRPALERMLRGNGAKQAV